MYNAGFTGPESVTLSRKIAAALIGVICTVLLLEAGLRTVGVIFRRQQDRRNQQGLRQKGAYRILCVGESTTATGGEHSYPSQLQRVLNGRRPGRRFKVINGAVPGADSSVILANMERLLQTYKPHLVLAMMGANDNHNEFGGGALPHDDVPMAERTGFPHFLKVYKLARLLWFNLSRKGAPADALSVVLRWEETGTCDAPAGRRGSDEDQVCALVRQARKQIGQGRIGEAEALLQGAIGRYPRSDFAHLKLGVLYMNSGRRQQSLAMFNKAIALNPRCSPALVEAGIYYRDHEQPSLARAALQAAVAADPRNYHALVALAEFYQMERELQKAEGLLKEAVRIRPELHKAHEMLGHGYEAQGRLEDAARSFRASWGRYSTRILVNSSLIRLLKVYERLDRREEIVSLIKRAMKAQPRDHTIVAHLAYHYKKWGDEVLARQYRQQSARIQKQFYCPMTRRNYRRLWSMTREQGIKLGCVQYPRKSVAPLKRIFPTAADVLFIENREVFERALERLPFDALFRDNCYGDFGHATPRGNRILAENIAAAILKAYF